MKVATLVLLSILICISCEKSGASLDTLFELRVNDTGITFENNLEYTEEFNPYTYRNFYNGGGVALADINNDGLLDIYFTGNIVNNQLYLNKGGWQFENITIKAGVACENVWSTGATFVDINHDGWLDLYVCKSGKNEGANRHNELFINNGDLTFTEKSEQYGLDIKGLSVHSAFFDYDKDGDLDCYVLNNSIRSIGAYDLIEDQREIPDSEGNKFLKNEGDRFIDFSNEAGIYSSAIGFGLGITLSDFNNDTWTDIFISNDFFERDYLYINNKKGGFDECLEDKFSSISMGSMGADASDLNNNLKVDLMVTEMLPSTLARRRSKAAFESWDKYSLAVKKGYFHQYPRNVLQRNFGNNGFLEVGRFAGVSASEWSWASLAFDMDNDGLRDILISNGIYKDLLDRDYLTYMANEESVRNLINNDDEVLKKLIDIIPSQAVPNVVFKNNGGFSFTEVASKWGLNQPSFSNGSAYGDLDNDGDLDVVINNVNMPAFLYENKTDTTTHKSIRLSFESDKKNTGAIGTKAIIKYGQGNQSMAENFPSRGFQSAVGSGIHFGVGNYESVDSLLIIWPNGAKTLKTNLPANKQYTFNQPSFSEGDQLKAPSEYSSILKKRDPLFKFKHTENSYVDFNRERLLPQMHNNEGPAFVSGDVNGDGKTDYYLGDAKNQGGSLFVTKGNDGYEEIKTPFSKESASEDTDALFFDSDNDGDLDLYVASGGKAFSKFDFALLDRLYINDGKGNFAKSVKNLPFKEMVSSSTVRATDFDLDGDLDLFVGGRFDPQLYGQPTSSYVLENISNNHFELLDQIALKDIGMVTDALWTDVNKDGLPDLIIVGEWMPITILINEKGVLVNKTSTYGLSDSAGLWSSLKLIDIDKDGDEDMVVGNVGKNSLYRQGDRMYINDFDHNGSSEQIICHIIGEGYFPIVDRDELLSQLPYLKGKLMYYKDYAVASMDSIFEKEMIKESTILNLDRTESVIYFNQEGKYIPVELPSEIQYSNVDAIEVIDVDNDGVLDIILGGNQDLVKPQFGKQDASKGWIVKGEMTENRYTFKKVQSMGISGSIRGFKIFEKNDKKILITAINNDSLQYHEIQ